MMEHVACGSCLQDPWTLTDPSSEAGGFSLGQLLYDVFSTRFGNGDIGSYTLLIFVVAMTLCAPAPTQMLQVHI